MGHLKWRDFSALIGNGSFNRYRALASEPMFRSPDTAAGESSRDSRAVQLIRATEDSMEQAGVATSRCTQKDAEGFDVKVKEDDNKLSPPKAIAEKRSLVALHPRLHNITRRTSTAITIDKAELGTCAVHARQHHPRSLEHNVIDFAEGSPGRQCDTMPLR